MCTKAEGEREQGMTMEPQSVEYDGTWNGEMGMEQKNESREDKLVPFLKGLIGHDFDRTGEPQYGFKRDNTWSDLYMQKVQ